jgi:DNA-binding NarL/FixJ family response regulator
MEKIRVFIVDDHTLFRNGLVMLLESEPGIEVAGEAENGQEFIQCISSQPPDVVLMDIEMPVMSGVEATMEACKRHPQIKVIALSMYGEQDYYYRMIEAGAKGFILKNSDIEEVIRAIQSVYQGGTYFSHEILYHVVKNIQEVKKEVHPFVQLSRRELDVLKLICEGLSNMDISQKLNISKRTVEKHRANVLSKTQTHNTASLVMYAIENKLITP